MVSVVVSLGVVVAGLWLTVSQNDTMMGAFGAVLMVLGATFLAVNLYLHRRGFRARRRP